MLSPGGPCASSGFWSRVIAFWWSGRWALHGSASCEAGAKMMSWLKTTFYYYRGIKKIGKCGMMLLWFVYFLGVFLLLKSCIAWDVLQFTFLWFNSPSMVACEVFFWIFWWGVVLVFKVAHACSRRSPSGATRPERSSTESTEAYRLLRTCFSLALGWVSSTFKHFLWDCQRPTYQNTDYIARLYVRSWWHSPLVDPYPSIVMVNCLWYIWTAFDSH